MKAGLSTFLAGFVAGAAAAFLFAPQSGKDTRNLVAEKARKGVDESSKAVREVAAKGGEVASRVRQQAEDAIETGRAAYTKAAYAAE